VTKLALVEVRGPFWTLTAVAPAFGLKNVQAPEKPALQEDRILPLRTLLADPGVPEDDAKNWRRPRLMSLHLIAGAAAGDYSLNGQSLDVTFPGVSPFDVGKDDFRTVDVAAGDLAHAAFQHVTVEPILDGDELWPEDNHAPPFRLVAGAIDLAAKANDLDFLGPLTATDKTAVIRLTPDGIELERKAPFPGVGDLAGRFLLQQTAAGMRLRLLTERRTADQLAEWRKAWLSVTAKDDSESRVITGVKLEGRRDAIPSFLWHVEVRGGGIQPLKRSVDVAASDLDVRLLSPRTQRGIDGEVTLQPESYTFAAIEDAEIPRSLRVSWEPKEIPVVVFAELKPAADANGELPTLTTRLRFEADRKALAVALKSTAKKEDEDIAHRCAHDEVKLATMLRRAYGLDDLLPGLPDRERPMLAGFALLDDGWLQVPVPNMPPPDVNKDDIVIPDTQTVGNVLSGYLRFAQTGNAPAVLSAFGNEPFDVAEAPWLITVEGAKGAAFIAGLKPAAGGATLLKAAAALDDPALSTRGLFWFSADRPDAFEGMPRIGAGAGAYFDVPLDTYDVEKQTALQFTLRALAIRVESKPDTQPFIVHRTALSVEVAFDSHSPTGWAVISDTGREALEKARAVLKDDKDATAAKPAPPLPPVRWQRHPVMPLATEMPMTRGAAASVRPLESRDLVPFVIEVDEAAKDKPSRWLRLTWNDTAVFPRLTRADDDDDLDLRPVLRWPWPRASSNPPDQGIALAAFGVPGAELAFPTFEDAESEPWNELQFALRYDIPALDEAFATATLPPQPPEKALPEEREAPPPVPVPLAYDWPAMRGFWESQVRRHQVARVANSYLVPLSKRGAAKSVANLVDGLPWKTTVDFTAGKKDDELPYGAAMIDDATLRAGSALRGISANFNIKSDELKRDDAQGPVKVLGYAPASFVDGDGFVMDSRLSGAKPAKSKNGMLWRALRDRRSGAAGLATLQGEVSTGDFFTFWFKDLPVDKNGEFKPNAFIDFEAWQDGHLPVSGFEWRLIPKPEADKDADKDFRLGRDLVPFFGFLLEPLRLTSCKLAMSGDVPASIERATIDARLRLGPLPRITAQDHNVVTLTLVADGTGALMIGNVSAADLEFIFDEPDTGSKSRVRLTTPVKWTPAKDGKPAHLDFDFQKAALFVTMFGEEREFKRPVIAAKADSVTAVWPETELPDPQLLPLKGTLAVHKVLLTVTGGRNVDLTLDRRIYLMPKAPTSVTKQVSDAPLRVIVTNDAVTEVKVLGIVVNKKEDLKAVELEQLDGAFTLRTSSAVPINGALLPGFPIEGTLSLGLAARLPAIVEGFFDLQAGRFDAEIVATKPTAGAVKIDRVELRGERRRRPVKEEDPPWRGDIRFHGRIEVTNAIAWPGIAKGDPIDAVIPFPGNPQTGRSGRKRVSLDGTSYTDSAVYTLDGHALPCDLASRLGDDKTLWTLPVVAKHTIMRAETVVGSFTCVETIAIGAARAVVPPPKLDADPLTFGPRLATTVVNGNDGKPETGMIEDRIGRIGTVLSGALGLPFRRAFWPADGTDRPGFFLAGGFVGLLTSQLDEESAPLLRLPMLVPLDGQALAIGQKGDGKAIEVAWTDSRAAREVIVTRRSAVAPASTSDSAIRAALLAGSRALKSIEPDDTVAAVLVEQSFAVPRGNADLATTPFFIAAAVSLARSLDRLQPQQQPTVLSLLAGDGIAGPHDRHGLAAAIVTRDLKRGDDPNVQRLQAEPELTTVGDDIVVHAWTGPNVAEIDDVVPVSLIAGPAFADHVQPRAVLLRTLENKQWRYDTPQLPRPFERPRAAAPVREDRRSFPDSGRGYPLPLGKEQLRWLRAPEEIEMMPVRDVPKDVDTQPALDGTTSGLAGLSRIAAMPAHAANVSGEIQKPKPGETNDPVRNNLVWIAQTRSPVYLPLGLSSVKAPPIPWLTPGTPRPRNPAAAALARAFDKIDVHVDENDRTVAVQPLLPAGATIASVGDRAGVSLARITRFETALGNLAAFDGVNARFGRPAQGGAWSVRTERTPRPGILPMNTGKEEERDRRPCASPLIVERSVCAIAGPADRIGGEKSKEVGTWTVTFVAAQEWSGRITDSWDGTLRLRAEIDVKSSEKPGEAVETLLRLLFPMQDQSKQLQASASVVIGNATVPFVRARFEPGSDFTPVDGLQRAVVGIVLDARRDDASKQPGAARRAIADALANDVLPPVQVELVVHPREPGKPVTLPEMPLELSSKTTGLAKGDARAPVTLRMPLAPVIRTRGALPLVPTSLLFVDRSYDAGLSSAPAQVNMLLPKPTAVPPLTGERGAVGLTLYADRSRINRKASITFMIDLAFEKKLDAFARELLGETADGDLVKDSAKGSFLLRVQVIPRNAPARFLLVANPDVTLAKVYELPLSSLTERDGKPAVFAAGDTLQLTVTEDPAKRVQATLVSGTTKPPFQITTLDDTPVTLPALSLILTDEPVAEPPSALYAALVRRERAVNDVALSLPLYAQSPLPWRVDLRDPKKDFRAGLMRRAAIFIWNLSGPKLQPADNTKTTMCIVKIDRNGQTFLPETKAPFEEARSI
jgi:hypothetical protein